MANSRPQNIADSYSRDLRKRVRLLYGYVNQTFVQSILPLLTEYQKSLLDDEAGLAVNVKKSAKTQRLFDVVSVRIQAEMAALYEISFQIINYKDVEKLASTFVSQVSRAEKRNLATQIAAQIGKEKAKKIIGLDLFSDSNIRTTTVKAVKQNVDLITTIPKQYLDRVESSVVSGLNEGKLTKTIAKEIKEATGVTQRRADFIANDQLGKVYGDTTRARQEKLGLKQFRWRTSGDNHVRDSHAAFDGKVYDWSVGAELPDGRFVIPGQDFNCRCTAEMVESALDYFTSLLEED